MHSTTILRAAAMPVFTLAALTALGGCKTSSTSQRITMIDNPFELHAAPFAPRSAPASETKTAGSRCADSRTLALGVLSSSPSIPCDASARVAATPFCLGAGDSLGRVLYAQYLASLDLPDEPALANAAQPAVTLSHAPAASDE